MTEYQLLYLRFLRMKEDFPDLNHRGHEPEETWESLINGAHNAFPTGSHQRRLVEREFYRL